MIVVVNLTALLAVLALSTTSATDSFCKLNLQQQLDPLKEPLILEINETRDRRQQLDFIWPEHVERGLDEKGNEQNQGVLYIPEGKKLLFACPGPNNNALKVTKKQTGIAECKGGQLKINGKPVNANTVSCTKDVANSIAKNTHEACGYGDSVGTKFLLGFKITDDESESFFPLVEVCHNIEKMETYYSSHQVYGKSLKGAVICSKRRPFSPEPREDGVYLGMNPDHAYKQEGQIRVLDILLGTDATKSLIEKNKVFLARGHLAPDADFIYNSGQQMTYYFINVAPQWQSFNAKNWLGVENAVRRLAANEDTTLNVWTGTYGILKLADSEGNLKEVYLDPLEARRKDDDDDDDGSDKSDKKPRRKPKFKGTIPDIDRLPVPEIYWKVVQHPETKACIVAVGQNNVKLQEEPAKMCPPVKNTGWPTLNDLDKGFVYYCKYEDFKKAVKFVPNVECEKVFSFK